MKKKYAIEKKIEDGRWVIVSFLHDEIKAINKCRLLNVKAGTIGDRATYRVTPVEDE